MKANVAALLLILVLLPTAASGTTLQVTSGAVSQNSDDTGDWGYLLRGDNFLLFSGGVDGNIAGFGGLSAAILGRGGPVTATLAQPISIILDGTTYPSDGGGRLPPFGSITFFFDPPPPFEPPIFPTSRQSVTSPFVMTGFADIGGTRFNLVGLGTVVETLCINCPGETPTTRPIPTLTVSYEFSAVPEPSPLWLLSFAGILAVSLHRFGMFRVRR